MVAFLTIRGASITIGMINMVYYYCVNTFRDGRPLQVEGTVMADDEAEAIDKLIEEGVVYKDGYEFLCLNAI